MWQHYYYHYYILPLSSETQAGKVNHIKIKIKLRRTRSSLPAFPTDLHAARWGSVPLLLRWFLLTAVLGYGDASAPSAGLARLLLLLFWFPTGCTLNMCQSSWEDGAFVGGGRTIVSELGCPFTMRVAYFPASAEVFSISFVFFPFV